MGYIVVTPLLALFHLQLWLFHLKCAEQILSSHNVDTRQSCLFVNMCTSSYSFLKATSFRYERSDDVNGAGIVLVVADVGVQLSNYLEGSATDSCTVTEH